MSPALTLCSTKRERRIVSGVIPIERILVNSDSPQDAYYRFEIRVSCGSLEVFRKTFPDSEARTLIVTGFLIQLQRSVKQLF